MNIGAIHPKLLIVVAILCGSASAALFWRTRHEVAPLGLSAQRLHMLGYASEAEYRDAHASELRLLDDLRKPTQLDETDFAYIRRTLESGTPNDAYSLLLNVQMTALPQQRRRILAILGNRPIPADLRPGWVILFRTWSSFASDKAIVPLLLGSGNPDVVSAEREALNAAG